MSAVGSAVGRGGELTRRAERFRSSPADGALVAAVVGAVLPVVAAMVARVGSGWQPSGDEAAIARLSHDVFSSHTPLLGMPSTIANGVKLAGGGTPHHLGPMLFWLFAIPDLISRSSPAALVITIALVNIASITAIAWQVRRRAGAPAAVLVMLAITLMLWSVGRDLTVQIWNPYAALLPLLLFLVLAWSVACGDVVAAPVAALVGSFVMQCHILYVLPVLGVGLCAAVAFVIGDRAARSEAMTGVTEHERRVRRRSIVATGIAVVVCWWTALYDQVLHHSGNLTRLFDSFNGAHQKRFGNLTAFRYLVRAIAVPPLFVRRLTSYVSFVKLGGRAGPLLTLDAMVVLAAIVVGTIAVFRLRCRAPEARLGVLAVIALCASGYVLARLPLEFGGVAVYRGRFLWIIGLYAWIALALLVKRVAPESLVVRVRAASQPAVAIAVAVAVVALGSGAFVARERSPAYGVLPDETTAVAKLSKQVRAHVSDRGPYLLGFGGGRAFGTVGFGVMWNLVRHGYDIRVLAGDPYLGAAHGLPRRAPVQHLVVVSAGAGFRAPADARQVAAYVADPELPRRLARAETAMISMFDQRPPAITVGGRKILTKTQTNEVVNGLRSVRDGRKQWRAMLDNHLLRALVFEGLLALPHDESAALDHFDARLTDSEDAFLYVFVEPPTT